MPKLTANEARLQAELTKDLANAISSNPSMTPEAVMRKFTREKLENNPFVPPKGCPVNKLPPELLANIFLIGTRMEEEYGYEDDDDDDDEDEDEDENGDEDSPIMVLESRLEKSSGKLEVEVIGAEKDDEEDEDHEGVLPFQVLVSHVCRHWREIAIESPVLWTTLSFDEDMPLEMAKAWIQRSKDLPLDVHIDCQLSEDDDCEAAANDLNNAFPEIDTPVQQDQDMCENSDTPYSFPPFSIHHLNLVLDLIIPHVTRWHSLDVTASTYEYIYKVLFRLADCAAAPQLEILQLYHYKDCEDYEAFTSTDLREAFLPFHGNAPKLRNVALWGVHLDWERSLSMLCNLQDLELSYHAKDARPSYATFVQMIALSPELRTLSLCLSGPQEHDDLTNDWGTGLIEIPSLKDLVLCYHESRYAIAFAQKLSVPNLHSLTLDFDGEDYSEFVKALTRPMPKCTRSILGGLEHLRISGLPCDDRTIDLMYEQLVGLKWINLNCSGEEERLFMRLMESASSTASPKPYCPNLHMITTRGIDGPTMRAFVEARRAAGFPVKQIMMSEGDEIGLKDEKWLRAHVEELDFFEPSDSEEELTEEEIIIIESGDESD